MADKSIRAPQPPSQRSVESRRVTGSYPTDEVTGSNLVLWMASIADTITKWGTNVHLRDEQLRDFWPSESHLAGAVYSSSASNATFDWELEGPAKTVNAVRDILQQAELGEGWLSFITKLSIALYTNDNGAFIEIIRSRNAPDAPIEGIATLDPLLCTRTGDVEHPVIYTDRNGKRHKMPWYSVIRLNEFPSTISSMYGVGYCAVTRVMKAAQLLRDISLYRGEKVGGRFAEAIHIVSGVKNTDLDDIRKHAEEQADNANLVRYLQPLIIGSLDPQSPPASTTINLRTLPEAFDFDSELKWYIAALALGFGREYQDFAPLPGGNLGSSQQSEILHLKARSKGRALFMRLIEHAFNFYGIMPRTVTFRFKEQDILAAQQHANARMARATARKIMIESGEVTPEIARQISQDDGDLKAEYIAMMGERDITPDVIVEGYDEDASDSDFTQNPQKLVPAEETVGQTRVNTNGASNPE